MGRSIRMTVNLCLIVAISLQQSVAPALQQSFSFACAAPASGQGCSCCDSQPIASGSTCCGQTAKGGSDSGKSHCCGHAQADAQRANLKHPAPGSVIQRQVDVQAAETPRSSAPLTCCADKVVKVDKVVKASSPASAPVKDTGCHCVHAPAAPATPYAPVSRTATSDTSNLVSLCCAWLVLPDLKVQSPRAVAWDDGTPSSFSHFAQIHLCVWRL